MKTILIVALVASGFGLLFVLFKLFKKGSKFAKLLPKNFLIFFLIYALLGLTGFTLTEQVTEYPLILSSILVIVSLTGGIIMADNMYGKWEWSMAYSFPRKLLYLFGIALTSFVTFIFIFLLCEHRGWPKGGIGADIVWWLAIPIVLQLIPLWVKHLHSLWNKIPKLVQVKPIFQIPVGASPPFIETGGATVNFNFVIPVDFRSADLIKSKVAVPLNKSLEEAFHYKIHEHNIVKRFVNKIVLAEENKRSKIYGWCFYRPKKIWWGFFTKKLYLNPKITVGNTIASGETIYVERIKNWK